MPATVAQWIDFLNCGCASDLPNDTFKRLVADLLTNLASGSAASARTLVKLCDACIASGDLSVGALDNGGTPLHLVFSDVTGTGLSGTCNPPDAVQVDWGDGNTDTVSPVTVAGLETLDHTYAGEGDRTVTFTITFQNSPDIAVFTLPVSVLNAGTTTTEPLPFVMTFSTTIDAGTCFLRSYSNSDPSDFADYTLAGAPYVASGAACECSGGFSSFLTQTVENVGAASSEILAPESGRHGGWIRNLDDAEDMFIFLGAGPATIGTGLGTIVPHDVYKLPAGYTGPVQAIRGGGGTSSAEVVTW